MPITQTRSEPRDITAISEADFAALFEDLPHVERVETGREDGTGNWAFKHRAEEYEGHTYVRVHLDDEAETHCEAFRTAEDEGHVVEGVGNSHLLIREGRDPLPENLTGLNSWDALIPGDRFCVGTGIAHEAIRVERDASGRVRDVEALSVYRIEGGDYDADDPVRFNDATINRIRRVQKNGSSAIESTTVSITEMHGEFTIADE